MKKTLAIVSSILIVMSLWGCTDKAKEGGAPEKNSVKLVVAAASSLEKVYKDQLIPKFRAKYPNIEIEGSYDSSGKLQVQIEEGLEADVFMSAAMDNMTKLKEKGLVEKDSIVELLENKIVLIQPKNSSEALKDFKDVARVKVVALGEPESVPAGKYAKEALTSLGLWDEVSAKASFGTNVTQVLNWVAEGSADAGIVYKTDAITNDKVSLVAEAPENSLKRKIVYPVGMVAKSAHPEEAKLFIEFLQSDEAKEVFKRYGFN